MENHEFAAILYNIADLLELKQENPFKVRAYRKAGQNIESLTENLEDLYKTNGLESIKAIPGIGEHIALNLEEAIKTKKSLALEKLTKEFPKGFLELSHIPGMGPKTALMLYKKLKIDSIEKLEKAAKAGKLRKISNMGIKKEQNILRGIALKKKSIGRFLLDDAYSHALLIISDLKQTGEAQKILACGSLRRGQETIGDIDILVVSDKPKIIMNAFADLSCVDNILSHGTTRSSVILKNGMQADLRVVEEKSFGSAAHYFTGSKAHNIHIRQLALKKGWKVSEYGIFSARGGSAFGGKGKKQIGGATEEEMFSMFGLQYIPPELREMRGEFEAAAKNKIPKLIELKDIKGDLHIHTKASDGANTIEQMAQAAKAKKYEYILITDHTQSTGIAHGLTEQNMIKHLWSIKKAAKQTANIAILAGAEVDILADGSLDYSDEILSQLDLVVAAIHSGFKMPKDKMTNRIIKAMQNKHINILAHPTGRLLNERDPYEVDMEKILQAAKKYNIAIELNANPHRLDLTDIYCKRAKELGVKIVISTDAHSIDQIALMKYGVITARRGWLEAKDVMNTLPLPTLLKSLKR